MRKRELARQRTRDDERLSEPSALLDGRSGVSQALRRRAGAARTCRFTHPHAARSTA
ncbi:MAG: hypothetical protein MZW92_00490 [Comamonadaceae bacterium]|nr:hypothetical protein [Comamonadaceae bacterium]